MKLESCDDASLIEQIAQGNPGALEALYDRYNRLVFSVALAVMGDHSVAEEVTLDVFMHVWRGAKTYRPERAQVRTWLLAITRHRAIDILRWQRLRPDDKTSELNEMSLQNESGLPDPEESAEMSALREDIRAAAAQLTTEQRRLLNLAYFKGYSHHQIAELLNQPLGTVKTRIRMAMQKLRQILSSEEPPSDKSDVA